MLPIIQAFANGETIEFNSEINPDKWYMVDKDDDELKFDRSPESPFRDFYVLVVEVIKMKQ